jgi:hypothetical protein
MKRILIVIGILLITGTFALAANNTVPRIFSGDQKVTTSNTILVDGYIYWNGLTVGDTIALLNGASTSAPAFIKVKAATANGYVNLGIKNQIDVDGGIYLDETITGGAAGVGLIFTVGQ